MSSYVDTPTHSLPLPVSRRLTKSTLLLIPLFGIHYTMFAFFPNNFKEDVKIVFELVVGSFQVRTLDLSCILLWDLREFNLAP